MNKIILIGRLTDDPSLKYTKNGKAVARMTVAVDRKYKNKDNEKQTDFIPVIAWGKLAETVSQYMRKGKLIGVEGTLNIRSYEQDSITKWIAETIADDIEFLEKVERSD